jgi:hypothetical protein
MEIAINLDMILFVNQSNIITINLEKRADAQLHAVANSMIIAWTGKPITIKMNCTVTVTYNLDWTGTVTTNDLCSRSLTGDIGASTGNMETSTDMNTSTSENDASTGSIDSSTNNIDFSISNISSSISDIDTKTREEHDMRTRACKSRRVDFDVLTPTCRTQNAVFNVQSSTCKVRKAELTVRDPTYRSPKSRLDIRYSTCSTRKTKLHVWNFTCYTYASPTIVIGATIGNAGSSTENALSTDNIRTSIGILIVDVDVSSANAYALTGLLLHRTPLVLRSAMMTLQSACQLPSLMLRSCKKTFQAAISMPRLTISGLHLPNGALPRHSTTDIRASNGDAGALVTVTNPSTVHDTATDGSSIGSIDTSIIDNASTSFPERRTRCAGLSLGIQNLECRPRCAALDMHDSECRA